MNKFASWAKRGLFVLSPLPLVVAMAASAAGPSDRLPASVSAAMQRDLGLTSDQLSQYLKIERRAMLQEKQLASRPASTSSPPAASMSSACAWKPRKNSRACA